MKHYVLSFGPYYFTRVKNVQGQPLAEMTQDPALAKQFKTPAAALRVYRKWRGTGVGMEKFHVTLPGANVH